MINRKLYIIGNGFDLHHNLETRYSHFCNYVDKNDKELFEFINCYVNVDSDKDGLWKDFENSLGTFDHKIFYGDYDNTDPTSDKFKLSDMRGLVDELSEISETMIDRLYEALYDWLIKLVYPDKGYKTLAIDINSKYLTFNYTDTLNKLYSIPKENILHIHNSVETHGSDLIFGHGRIIEQEPLFDSEGNSNYPTSDWADAKESSKMFLAHSYKDTQAIIKENIAFFNDLIDIDEIIVLGHSLNDIDLLYFEYLHTIAYNAKWTVSYYDKSECKGMKDRLFMVGVKYNISFIKLDNLGI